MGPSLAIGDFARATHMSVKTLRHYHHVGLLDPADVDPFSGYRRYTTDQIPTAQVIRRFRALDMPLGEIRAVLAAPDPQTRNDLLATHLSRLEDDLAQTQSAVASLRDLLQHASPKLPIEHRSVGATTAAAISEVLDVSDALMVRRCTGRAARDARGARICRPPGQEAESSPTICRRRPRTGHDLRSL